MDASANPDIRLARRKAQDGQRASSLHLYDRSQASFEEALKIFTKADDRAGMVEMLCCLGELSVEKLKEPLKGAFRFGLATNLALQGDDPPLLLSTVQAVCQAAMYLRRHNDYAALWIFPAQSLLTPIDGVSKEIKLSERMKQCADLGFAAGRVIQLVGQRHGETIGRRFDEALQLAREIDQVTHSAWRMEQFVSGN